MLTLQFRVNTFFNCERFEISLPHFLKQLFVFGHKFFIQPTFTEKQIVVESHLSNIFQIVMKAIIPARIINYPLLIGKTFLKM